MPLYAPREDPLPSDSGPRKYRYRLHPVGPVVLAGPIFHPLEDAPEVLAFYREFIATAPDE